MKSAVLQWVFAIFEPAVFYHFGMFFDAFWGLLKNVIFSIVFAILDPKGPPKGHQ